MSEPSRLGGLRSILLGLTLSPAPSTIAPPPILPDSLFPCLTIQEVTAEEIESLGGLSGLTGSYLQINAWSPRYDEAFALRAALVSPLSTFSGAITGSALKIDKITDFRYRELYDASLELHQLILRCLAWWTT